MSLKYEPSSGPLRDVACLFDVGASAEEREDDVEVPAATRKVERCPSVRPSL